jgi:hypothetical protein
MIGSKKILIHRRCGAMILQAREEMKSEGEMK